jgi:hypothetical protein
MTIQLVGVAYAVQTDCSILATHSMKVKELGAAIRPVSRIYVVAPTLSSLELYGIQAGAGPGMPVDLTTSRRISMQEFSPTAAARECDSDRTGVKKPGFHSRAERMSRHGNNEGMGHITFVGMLLGHRVRGSTQSGGHWTYPGDCHAR